MPLQQRTWRVYCLRLSHMRYKRKRDKCFWTMARSYLHDYMQEKGSNRRTKNPVLRNGTAVQKSYDSRYEKENFRAIQQMMCKGHLFCRHTTKRMISYEIILFYSWVSDLQVGIKCPVLSGGRCVLLPLTRRSRAHLPPVLSPCPTPA